MAGAGPKSTRTAEQRAKLRRRYQLIAMQTRFAVDPAREREIRERGERAVRRHEMRQTVERVKAAQARDDAAERAENGETGSSEYYYNYWRIPREQRR